MLATIMELDREKAAEKRKVQKLQQTLRDFRASITNHVDQVELFETIYEANPDCLSSDSRVHADDAIEPHFERLGISADLWVDCAVNFRKQFRSSVGHPRSMASSAEARGQNRAISINSARRLFAEA